MLTVTDSSFTSADAHKSSKSPPVGVVRATVGNTEEPPRRDGWDPGQPGLLTTRRGRDVR